MGKISMNAGNLGEGGFSEGDAQVVSHVFEKQSGDYGDQIVGLLGIQTDDMDKPSVRFYNVGKAKNIMVVDDGAWIETIDDDREYKISKNSAFGKMHLALENSGLPTARLDKDGANTLIGERFHFESVASGTRIAAAMLCIGFAAGIFKPLIAGTVRLTTDSTNATLGFGIFYAIVNVGASFGPIVAGKLRAIS